MQYNKKLQNKENIISLNELLASSFSINLIALNRITIDKNYKPEEKIITLSKFKHQT